MRSFVAIDIPGGIRNRIQGLIDALRRAPADVRWSRPEGLHITLKFLGEIPAGKVEEVQARLQSLPPFTPITIQISGSGFFPNDRAPRVLWLGIQSGPKLGDLAASLEKGLDGLGISKEDRAFNPHLTLGRIRGPGGLPQLRDQLQQQEPLDMGSFTAEEFFLYESQLAPGGSTYKKLAYYRLASPSAAPE